MARQITVKQLINAIRKDGYKQAYGSLWLDTDGEGIDDNKKVTRSQIGAACALGQARVNLRLMDNRNWTSFGRSMDRSIVSNIGDTIIDMNDGQRLPLPEIADRLEEEFADSLDVVLWEQE